MLHNGRSRLLSPSEETALGLRAHAGDLNARDDLVAANHGLVAMVVGPFHRRPGDGELDQAGLLGLIQAAARFDPEHYPGVRFSTYAIPWIYLEVVNCLKSRRIVHSPHYLEVRAARGRRDPRALAASRARRQHLCFGASTDEELGSEGPGLAAVPADHRQPEFETSLRLAEMREEISVAMFGLSDLERLVIRRRYGLDDGEPRTLRAIAAELGVSKERIRQIEQRALAAMRAVLCAPEGNASCVA